VFRTTGKKAPWAFTIIELLVVVAVIAILSAILLPVLGRAKHLSWEIKCASNLRQINYALVMYANNNDDYYPVEPHEHNPHPALLEKLKLFGGQALYSACYCPQSDFMEQFAQNTTDFKPTNDSDSVMDTPENRAAGNISYVYWSFYENKGANTAKAWRGVPFFPRLLKTTGMVLSGPEIIYQTKEDKPNAPGWWQIDDGSGRNNYVDAARDMPLSRIWVLSDFFRRGGADFPHVRDHAGGLNVLFLDGHVELVIGRPRDNYK
jgi:prepilin-type processing-associated H-X9-DG protein/prepilin-type N-terminal cleavage/methylation domain-containing protein